MSADRYRLFSKNDLSSFWALFADNLANLVLIMGVCSFVFKMPGEVVFGHILPGLGVALLVGLSAYAALARKLARGEAVSEAWVRKGARWWGRNKRFADAEPGTPAYAAAQLWGGRDWFSSIVKRLDKKEAFWIRLADAGADRLGLERYGGPGSGNWGHKGAPGGGGSSGGGAGFMKRILQNFEKRLNSSLILYFSEGFGGNFTDSTIWIFQCLEQGLKCLSITDLLQGPGGMVADISVIIFHRDEQRLD